MSSLCMLCKTEAEDVHFGATNTSYKTRHCAFNISFKTKKYKYNKHEPFKIYFIVDVFF